MRIHQRATLKLFGLLKDQKKLVGFLIFLVVLATGFDIVVPFISQRLIDTLIQFFKIGGTPPAKTLIITALLILLSTVFARIVKSVYDYRLFKMATRLEDSMRHRAVEKYLNLHALFHHGASSGQVIGRIERGANGIFAVLHDILGQNFLPPLMVFLGVLVVLALKNFWIAIVVFLPLPVYLLCVQHLTEKIYLIDKRAIEKFELVTRESYDVAANVLTVKKFSREDAETQHQAKLQAEARETEYEAQRLWEVIANTQTGIAATGRIAIILIAGFLVLGGKSTIGEFVLYVTLQNMAYSPIAQLSNIYPRLRRNAARVEKLFGILEEPIRVADKIDAIPLPAFRKRIEFRNISFRYAPTRNWAIQTINIVIPAGKTVALVGRSGSGKTTFVNLLLRSYDPDEGAILIDGHDLRDVTQESLRNQIAVVPQEVDLFSRTIGENIAYGKPEVGQEEIVRAAEIGLAHDFIMKLEKGYGALVGERGLKLSGGERQRIGIARAVLRDPKILILDEATSHLDTESEKLIQKATHALIKNRTAFIIAHRLSTVLHADMIMVFNKGQVEAVGRHKALLGKSPTYNKLYSLQFSEPVVIEQKSASHSQKHAVQI